MFHMKLPSRTFSHERFCWDDQSIPFAIVDVEGPDAERMLEDLSVAKVGGDTPEDKIIYTNFLDEDGGVCRPDHFSFRIRPISSCHWWRVKPRLVNNA